MGELVRSLHGLGILVKSQWTTTRRLYSTRRDRGSRPDANRVTFQTALTKKVARSENGDDRLFADFIDYGELHTAFLHLQRRAQRHHLELKPQRESVHNEIDVPLLCD
jgi:hypothetical protein